jgi:hypothetical protein
VTIENNLTKLDLIVAFLVFKIKDKTLCSAPNFRELKCTPSLTLEIKMTSCKCLPSLGSWIKGADVAYVWISMGAVICALKADSLEAAWFSRELNHHPGFMRIYLVPFIPSFFSKAKQVHGEFTSSATTTF